MISMLRKSLTAVLAGVICAMLWMSDSANAVTSYKFQESFTYLCNGYAVGKAPFAIAVDAKSGDAYVGGFALGGIERFDAQHKCEETLSGTLQEAFGVTVNESTAGGYATDYYGEAVDKYNTAHPAELVSQCTVTGHPTAVAVEESTGDFYVMVANERLVDKFDPNCKLLLQIKETPNSAPIVKGPFGERLFSGLAVDQTTGDVYVADVGVEKRPTVIDKFSGSGSFLLQFGGERTPSRSFETNGAGLDLAVDPTTGDLFVADKEHRVVDEFTTAGEYVNQLNGAETPAGSFEPVALGIDAKTDDLYVGDSTGAGSPGEPAHEVVDVFKVQRVHDVETGSASNVGPDAAMLNGTINPLGVQPTSCMFEYGVANQPYERTVACRQALAEIGSGETPVAVSAAVSGLVPGKEYHFRLVTNLEAGGESRFVTPVPPTLGEAMVGDVTASSATFTGSVNPGGGETTYRFEYGQSTFYGSSVPVPDGDAGSGLSTVTITAHATELVFGQSYHFRLVASNAAGVVYGPDRSFTTRPLGGPFSLPDGRIWELVSPVNKRGAQIFTSSQGGGGGAALQASMEGGAISYSALGTLGEGAVGNTEISQVLSRREQPRWSSQNISTPHSEAKGATFVPEFHFFSFDLSLAVVHPLDEPPLVPGGSENSYYLRNNTTGTYSLFDGLEGSLTDEEWKLPLEEWYAEQLRKAKEWYAAHGHATAMEESCEETAAPVDGGVILGASYNSCEVYFMSSGALAPGATAGMDNLYGAREEGGGWTTAFVATVSAEDERDWRVGSERQGTAARVSPNGRYLAFMSNRSLTGYDNTDMRSGVADEEVFLYDADTRRLVCASCNPTGERPEGLRVVEKGSGFTPNPGPLIDYQRAWESHWLAGSLVSARQTKGFPAYYQPRNLSDSGRLFFDSPDALVAQDVNDRSDVYQYEPEGVGDCSAASSTLDTATGGCLSLISSGLSSEESAFFDASVDGADAFFLTRGSLNPEDRDTNFDVYDAHACTAISPCVTPPLSPSPCSTSDSCRLAPTPQPPIYGPPASGTFSGEGNNAAPTSHGRPKSTLTQKLAHALKACKRLSHKKRVRCEARARKKYKTRRARQSMNRGRR